MKKNTKNKILGITLMLVGTIYLLNFTAGIIEFIPDNLPIIGNIDEGIAGALLVQGWRLFTR